MKQAIDNFSSKNFDPERMKKFYLTLILLIALIGYGVWSTITIIDLKENPVEEAAKDSLVMEGASVYRLNDTIHFHMVRGSIDGMDSIHLGYWITMEYQGKRVERFAMRRDIDRVIKDMKWDVCEKDQVTEYYNHQTYLCE